MKTLRWLNLFASSFFLTLAGCANSPTQEQKKVPENISDEQKEFYCPMHPHIAKEGPGKCPICAMPFSDREAGITKLSPEDQKLVAAQAYCPVANDSLGPNGIPFKIIMKGQAIFLCCKDCEKSALANPDKTLATFEQLQTKKKPALPALKREAAIKAALTKLLPEDRKLAEAQRSCPILMDLLGSMGTPIKIIIKGQPVFLCCKGCEKSALANSDQTLASVERLRSKKNPVVPDMLKVEPIEK